MADEPKKNFVVDLVEDEEGNLMLPFPVELLSQMGWGPGTDLSWIDNQNGTFTIKEKKDGETL
jgi:hypothetical protein